MVGRKALPPDPRIADGLGRNHSFESAIADLIDNSLDAGARNVLVRFFREQGKPAGVFIVDDGRGMDSAEIDVAMTLGGRRSYQTSDLGHFGLGLKAASFGQAQSLTVVSKTLETEPVARRLSSERVGETFECEVLSSAFANSVFARSWNHFVLETGTVVIWNEVRAFPRMLQGNDTETFLDAAVAKLARHLGLIFHRFIDAGKLCITIDQEDTQSGEVGFPFPVLAVDPFGYPRSGRVNFPATLSAEEDGHSLRLVCHIWPGRSNRNGYRLLEGRGEEFQGFFVYRNGRIIQPGGWNNLVSARKELQLARVEVDISNTDSKFFEMNPEKTSVTATELFRRLAQKATGEGASFKTFLDDAADSYRESRKRVRSRPKVLAPGSGIAPSIKSALSDEFDFLEGRDPIEIRWDNLADDQFFDVQKEGHLIRLNRKYRTMLTSGERGSLNDAPVVKALMYLLVESTMQGEYFGPRDKDNLSIWQSVLTAAANSGN